MRRYVLTRQLHRATEIINHRGTVSWNVQFPDKSVYEKFVELEKKVRSLVSAAVGNGPLPMVINMIDSDPNIRKGCSALEEVTNQLRNKARKAKYSGQIPRTAKEIQKRLQKDQQKATSSATKAQGQLALDPTAPTFTPVETEVAPGTEPTEKISKNQKKKNKRKEGKEGADEHEAGPAQKAPQVQTDTNKSPEVKMVEIQSLRSDIAQLGRVEIVIPSLFGAISSFMGFSS